MASDSTQQVTRSIRREEDTAFWVGIPRATCPPEIYVDHWIHEGMINGGVLDALGMRTRLFMVTDVIILISELLGSGVRCFFILYYLG